MVFRIFEMFECLMVGCQFKVESNYGYVVKGIGKGVNKINRDILRVIGFVFVFLGEEILGRKRKEVQREMNRYSQGFMVGGLKMS